MGMSGNTENANDPDLQVQEKPESILTTIENFFDMDKRFPRTKEVKMNRVKLEPKTYFANERTSLKWISFAIIILGIGLSMFFSWDLWYTYVLGFIMVFVAMLAMSYSFYNFRWRAAHIRNRAEERYDDVWGPIALFCLMSMATLIGAGFQIADRIRTIENAQ